jgi:hypothetical protein
MSAPGAVDPRFIDLVVSLRRAQEDFLEMQSQQHLRTLRELGDQVDKWLADYMADLRKLERWARPQ